MSHVACHRREVLNHITLKQSFFLIPHILLYRHALNIYIICPQTFECLRFIAKLERTFKTNFVLCVHDWLLDFNQHIY